MRLFDWLKPQAPATADFSCFKTEYPEARRIADSIRKFPDDWAWHHKGYELKHVPSGFVMWVANKDYGLAEMTSHGGKQKFDEAEQQIIWPAVEAWLARGKVGFTGRLPKVKISGKRGTYWCVADGHPWAGVGDSPARAYESWAKAVSVEQRRLNPGQRLSVWSAPQ